jgi:dTDP-4-amino-4,6-dideoxygalactose transaminase
LSNVAIPLVDLSAQHAEIAAEVHAGFDRVMRETSFVLGPAVTQFEAEFAAYCEVRHCIGVGNGTDALELMLRACDIGLGDEVLVPANTFIATALAVIRAGARPVLVDSDLHYLMDVDQVEQRITPRTRAILAVDLYGQIAAMDQLAEIARRHGLVLLEDAAQSQGARRHGRRAGSVALAAATSFYPGKNIGAYGDGGAVLTDSDDIASHVRKLRNWGSERKYHHPEVGFNSRLDSMQAVVLSAKLRRLDAWNDSRRRAAHEYDVLLRDVDAVQLPQVLPGNEHVWHLYVVQVAARDEALAALQAHGIGAGIHYPTPLHFHGALAQLGYRAGEFPVAERASARILSLPMYPHLTTEQQGRIAETLRAAISSGVSA